MNIETTTTTVSTHSFAGMTDAQIVLIWKLLTYVRLGEGEYQHAALDLLEAMADSAEVKALVDASTVKLSARACEGGPSSDDFIVEISHGGYNSAWAW